MVNTPTYKVMLVVPKLLNHLLKVANIKSYDNRIVVNFFKQNSPNLVNTQIFITISGIQQIYHLPASRISLQLRSIEPGASTLPEWEGGGGASHAPSIPIVEWYEGGPNTLSYPGWS